VTLWWWGGDFGCKSCIFGFIVKANFWRLHSTAAVLEWNLLLKSLLGIYIYVLMHVMWSYNDPALVYFKSCFLCLFWLFALFNKLLKISLYTSCLGVQNSAKKCSKDIKMCFESWFVVLYSLGDDLGSKNLIFGVIVKTNFYIFLSIGAV